MLQAAKNKKKLSFTESLLNTWTIIQFSIASFVKAFLFASELPDDPYMCTNPAQTFVASKSKPGCQVHSQMHPFIPRTSCDWFSLIWQLTSY